MRRTAARVGLTFGARQIHGAVWERGRIRRTFVRELPEVLEADGQISSIPVLAELLRELRREENLRTRDVALVLPASLCTCRRITTAWMTPEQLAFNLPFTFRDYLDGEPGDWLYDWAVVETNRDEAEKPGEMDLMAAAVRRGVMADLRDLFRRAGLRLRTAIPEEMAYINLIRASKAAPHSHGILDLGHRGIRLYLYTGDRFESLRTLDDGCAALHRAVGDHFGADPHLTEVYLHTDFQGAAGLETCRNICGGMAVEVLKAVNFYRFRSGGESLAHVHCCGGGTENPVDMDEFPCGPDGTRGCAAAAGAALQEVE